METNKLQNIEKFQGERRGGLIRSEKWNDNFNKIVDNLNQNANTINENFESITAETIPAVINEEDSNLQIAVNTMLEYIDDRYTKEEIDTHISVLTANLVKDVTVDTNTGVITIIKSDDTSVTFDTMLEKIPVKVEFVEESGVPYLLVTNDDGSTFKTDLSNLVDVYDVQDSDTIRMSKVSGNGSTTNPITFSSDVKENSIELKHLNLDAVTQLEGYVNSASLSATNASVSEGLAKGYSDNAEAMYNLAKDETQSASGYADDSEDYSLESKKYSDDAKGYKDNANTYSVTSKSYAIGGTGTRINEGTDNAKYYAQQASASKVSAESAANNAAQNTTMTILSNVDSKMNEVRAELQTYVSSAEDSAETAEYWAKQAEESAGGDFVTNTVFNTRMDTKADLVNGKVDPNQLPAMDYATTTEFNSHKNATNNPHSVTKAQIGLGNVDNTSDMNKPVSTAMQTALNSKADLIDGKVDPDQLPEISAGAYIVNGVLPSTLGEYAQTCYVDKTFAEIQQAFKDGKIVYLYATASDEGSDSTRVILKLTQISYDDFIMFSDSQVTTDEDNIQYCSNLLVFVSPNEGAFAEFNTDKQIKNAIRFDNEVTTVIGDDLKGESYTVEFTEDVVDNAPTENSPNLVTSGGVFKAIADIDVGEQLKETVRFDNEVSTVLADVLKSNEYVLEFSEEENESEYPPFAEDFSAVKSVVFGDGTITETYAGGISKVTTFNEDGSITEELTTPDGTTRKKTTFNEDGTISEVIL